jgi:hypothetical protein
VLSAVFTGVLLNAIMELSDSPLNKLMPTTRELDRNLRVIQAFFLIALLGLIFHYSIPLGRNLWSMLIGYGLLVGTGVITFTLSSQFPDLNWKWSAVPIQLEYCTTLVVWCVGLWSYQPNPTPGVNLERDYQRISAETSRVLRRLRDNLAPWSE